MAENLVIVESPAKAKTIEKFLGKDFLVKSSFGHIRDLEKKNYGIDIENNYRPNYIVSEDKKKVVAELKKLAKQAKMVWIASDEDREGEAIAWHLAEVLKLKPENTKRIVFHEITKKAILKAIETPRDINIDLVNAQQARRVLDRLVGFELSPVLWKKVKPSLSAGRVQSVSVRLLVEQEMKIRAFKPESYFKTSGLFNVTDVKGKTAQLIAELNTRLKDEDGVMSFLESCKSAQFKIADVITKPAKKTPPAPFTTSTLQQEASRKFGFSVAQTMAVAQRLYEAGKITYMRTDSLNLSGEAISAAEKTIKANYGDKYHKKRIFKSKIKGAQEAHEAIRPSYMDKPDVAGSAQEKKLYNLIWKRTIASQMSDAGLEKTTISISNNNNPHLFNAQGEVLIFDGFLKVYIETAEDDQQTETAAGLLPAVKADTDAIADKINAYQRFTNHPPRFTEASLVKKLEELGIGRPSTYAPTISTIQNRGYVEKESREGSKRDSIVIALKGNEIKKSKKTEGFGAEKNKLFPTDIGIVVTNFLVTHFKEIMNYNFTARVEKDFDEIADGKCEWSNMIDDFYKPFHKQVDITVETSERTTGERILGEDPKTGKPISVRIGRYGPMAQIGKADDEEKPTFAALRKNQNIDTITLEEAIDLFKLPRTLGNYEDKTVVAAIGRFGPYIRHDSKFVSLKKDVDDPMEVDLERAIVLIEEKRKADREKVIQIFDEDPVISVLNGRWGPYISFNKKNYKIPKTTDPTKLTLEDCKKLIADGDKQPKKKKPPRKSSK